MSMTFTNPSNETRIRSIRLAPVHYISDPTPPEDDDIHDIEDEEENIISRNYYGAEILNCKKLFITDVDTEVKHEGLNKIIAAIEEYSEGCWRVYETRNGFRVFRTDCFIKPDSALAHVMFNLFDSDDMYVKGCLDQLCYRARLTPKPERIGVAEKFPKGTTAEDWLKEYKSLTRGYSVCRLAYIYSLPKECEEIRSILSIHDEYVLNGDRPLA